MKSDKKDAPEDYPGKDLCILIPPLLYRAFEQ